MQELDILKTNCPDKLINFKFYNEKDISASFIISNISKETIAFRVIETLIK